MRDQPPKNADDWRRLALAVDQDIKHHRNAYYNGTYELVYERPSTYHVKTVNETTRMLFRVAKEAREKKFRIRDHFGFKIQKELHDLLGGKSKFWNTYKHLW